MDFQDDHFLQEGNNSTNTITANGKNPLLRQFAILEENLILEVTQPNSEGVSEVADTSTASLEKDNYGKTPVRSVETRAKRSWLKYFTDRTGGRRDSLRNRRTPQHIKQRRILRTHIGKGSLRKIQPQTNSDVATRSVFNRSISVPNGKFRGSNRPLRFRRAMSNKELSTENRTHEYRIIEQTKDFCRDIIIQTLKRNNMFNRVKLARAPTRDKTLSFEIQSICSELERRNPTLCKNISKQIGITLRSEEVLRKIFFELASEIILSDKDVSSSGDKIDRKRRTSSLTDTREEEHSTGKDFHITWGRILGIFVTSGAFAIDCIKQGHSELVSELIEFNGDFFMEEGLIDWISLQGGWRKLSEVNSLKVKEVDPASVWNILLMSACIFAVLAFGVGVIRT